MEFNKRTVLWIVFAISLIVLWNNWMVANGKQSLFSAQPPAQVAQQTKPTDVPAAAQPGSAAVPGAPAAAATAVPGAPAAAPAAPVSQIVTVTTDVVKVDIDSVGGVIKRLELLHYPDHFDKTRNQVLFNVNGPNVYLGQTGLIGTSAAGVLPNLPGFLNAALPASFPNVGEAFKTIYTYAWFVGVAIAALVYGVMMRKRA